MRHKDKRTGRIGRERYDTIRTMIAEGKTALAIADALGLNAETVRKFARKRNLIIPRHSMTFETHPAWCGGHTVDRTGYL